MTTGLLALAILVMKLWPQTPTARFLRDVLIDLPMAMARKADRKQILALIILIVMAQSFAAIGAIDIAHAMALDYATYVDAAITVWTLAAVTRAKGVWRAAASRLPRLKRARPRRPRRSTLPMMQRKPANDDDGEGALARAA